MCRAGGDQARGPIAEGLPTRMDRHQLGRRLRTVGLRGKRKSHQTGQVQSGFRWIPARGATMQEGRQTHIRVSYEEPKQRPREGDGNNLWGWASVSLTFCWCSLREPDSSSAVASLTESTKMYSTNYQTGGSFWIQFSKCIFSFFCPGQSTRWFSWRGISRVRAWWGSSEAAKPTGSPALTGRGTRSLQTPCVGSCIVGKPNSVPSSLAGIWRNPFGMNLTAARPTANPCFTVREAKRRHPTTRRLSPLWPAQVMWDYHF